MQITKERCLSDAVAYIDGNGDLRVRIPTTNQWGMDMAVTFLAGGEIDLTRQFYVEDAKEVYYPGDKITITF